MNKTILFLLAIIPASIFAQAPSRPASIALAPARFELEMKPGTETTVVVNLDYKQLDESTKPLRIVASLNDWTMTKDGRVEYFPANTRRDSASSWLIYTPGEATVAPGAQHQIRVTVSVPLNATPGDHLAALIIEQRPDTAKFALNSRQVNVRYRMASVFYIKVGSLTRQGNFGNLLAEADSGGFTITPLLKNEGNSVIRPTASISVLDTDGKPVVEVPDVETLPILANAEMARPLRIEKALAAGKYTVKYRVDFQDGRPATEGITDIVIAAPQIAASGTTPKKP